MKKVLIILGLLIASFTFNSCELLDDLQEQACGPEFNVKLFVNQIRVQIVSSTLANGTVDWTAQKIYCDGDKQDPWSGRIEHYQFSENQYAQQNINIGWNLNNSLDYVIMTATLSGKTVSHRFDYKTVPDGMEKYTMVVDFVFNF